MSGKKPAFRVGILRSALVQAEADGSVVELFRDAVTTTSVAGLIVASSPTVVAIASAFGVDGAGLIALPTRDITRVRIGARKSAIYVSETRPALEMGAMRAALGDPERTLQSLDSVILHLGASGPLNIHFERAVAPYSVVGTPVAYDGEDWLAIDALDSVRNVDTFREVVHLDQVTKVVALDAYSRNLASFYAEPRG